MNDTAPAMDLHASVEDHMIEKLRAAAHVASAWDVVYRPMTRSTFSTRVRTVRDALIAVETEIAGRHFASIEGTPSELLMRDAGLRALRENSRLLRGVLLEFSDSRQMITHLPRVVLVGQPEEPRIAEAAAAYWKAVDWEFSAATFTCFVRELQGHDPLTAGELWSLPALLKFVLLESLLAAVLGAQDRDFFPPVSVYLQSLRAIGRCNLATLIEPLIVFDTVLQQDPADAYHRMDFESRELYRKRVAFVALHSDMTEFQVAQAAVKLAREAARLTYEDERLRQRHIHVGYYLLDAGFAALAARTGFHASQMERLRMFLRANANEVYINGIEFVTILIVAALILPVAPDSGFSMLAITCALLLLPASQIVVEMFNSTIAMILPAQALPKLDFNEGVPASCTTLVTVPTLLLNETQVRELAADLEVRYLANRDPHLHFALLTDLPDSVAMPRKNDSHVLVDLAVSLIEELNSKYRSKREVKAGGSFLLFHRHRIFNKRQGVWMGWERKRGKLLDMNKLLTGEFDAFPVKAGPIDTLAAVRYILTLDSDTQLPRGSAMQLIGAIAHPLNRAIVDPERRVVTAGYGILQPRVGVTVHSASRSHLASIYSGQSGLDTYTRAVSDTYQDLFGEGVFTGKGIYEVATLHTVLNHRFPRNVLLSHDLIEGAYARAGLATDIEIVDDYPSHYSAHTRRKHRWVRGDWQIIQWIFWHVPDEAGHWVRNPISGVSRWKIFDNLRRSLVEPFTFFLFLAGWLGLPGGPLYWTIVSLVLVSFPVVLQLGFGLSRSMAEGEKGRIAEVFSNTGQTILLSLLYLIFLPHQTFLSVDAIFRSLIRRFITGERLLEWETAAQAESGTGRRTPVDRYLSIMPGFAIVLAALIYLAAPNRWTILIAAPILFLWGTASGVTRWLNRSPREQIKRLRSQDNMFLLSHAIRIWRYFREFSSERHHYLIPDNVEEDHLHEAGRVSPTNAGFLLNARQAALELGLLTAPEFATLTLHSLTTLARLEKYRGHLFNWYDTQTLDILQPRSISSVDSGNFVASLYTLCAGVRMIGEQPLLTAQHFHGVRALWRFVQQAHVDDKSLSRLSPPDLNTSATNWVGWLVTADQALAQAIEAARDSSVDLWWLNETKERVDAVLVLLRDYMPWLQPEYAPLFDLFELDVKAGADMPALNECTVFCELLKVLVTSASNALNNNAESRILCERLCATLSNATQKLRALTAELRAIASHAEEMAEATDFHCLAHPERKLLSIGYDVDAQSLHDSCYDMLASEARIATFLAIARDELPQQGWFNLNRSHTEVSGQFLLLSWTGTMFEYLMPALWMRSYPETLISRTLASCVRVQRSFARSHRILWGISESGFSRQDDAGHYQYHAFGIPDVALKADATAGPVISPYSTFLALGVDAIEAVRNLRRMPANWLGSYGFYEAIDYTHSTKDPTPVREWMAHHQGMSLLAIANLLCDNVTQRWFHANALVQSAEILLHELHVNTAVLRTKLKEADILRIR